jgi:hypothetical protein
MRTYDGFICDNCGEAAEYEPGVECEYCEGGVVQLVKLVPLASGAAGEGHDWREEAWQCYVASGADPDGADARHLNPGEAVAAVRGLMKDYDDALEDVRDRPTRGGGCRK